MQVKVIGVGGLDAVNASGSAVRTFALGSCVAVTAYDANIKVAGMVHVALSDSAINKERAKAHPGYFADTGIASLFLLMSRLRGGMPGARGLTVKIAGGANLIASHAGFQIGKRNIEAVLARLQEYGAVPTGRDVGGTISRTVTIETDTGRVTLSSPGRGEWVI